MGRLSNDPTVVDGNTDLSTNKLTAESATDMSSGSFSGIHHDHDGDTSMDDRAKAARDQILGVLFDEQEAEETANTNIVVSSREEDDHNLKQAEKKNPKAKHGGAATLYQQQAKLEPKDKTSSAASNRKTGQPPAELSASARAIELQERVLSLVLSEEFHFGGGEGDHDDDEDVDVFDDKTKAKLDKAYKTNGSSSSSEKKMAAAPKKKTHQAKTAAKTGTQEGKGNAKENAKDEKAAVGIRMDAEEGAAFTPPMPLPHLAAQASSASSARVASESTLPGAVAIRGSRTERLGFGILTSQHNRGNNTNSNSNLSLAGDNDDDVTFTYNDLEAGQGHPAPGPEQARSGTGRSRDQHAVSSASDAATEREQGLAEAHLVNEEDDQPIANADPVDMNAPRRQRTSSSQKTAQAQQEQTTQYGLLAIFLCGVVVVAIMMAIVFGTDAMNSDPADNSTSNSTAVMMTAAPTPAPTPDPWALAKESGLPDYTLQAIQEDSDQPAAKAYQWLLEDVATANNSMPAWRQVQRFTLALVYHALGGDAWNAKEGWLDHTADECRDWFFRKVISSAPQMGKAVIFVHESETNQTELIESPCDEEGRFTHLAFAGSNLVGAIPREIALLTSLIYLDISANIITGSLPTEIAFLTNLERLFANRNFISGSIPTEVGLLTNLEMFDVGNNQNFEGPIPSEFGLLSNSLTIFSTQRSSVTGFIPTELFLLTNLEEYLIHQSLNITGGTLEGIGKLSNLREFVAHDTPYKSTIPTELGLLTNLLNFNLWNTQVTGPIPSELWSLTSLRRIDMDDNFLTGPFPSGELGQMSNLQVLFINGNRLTGTLPSTPWERMPNVSLLSIGGNNGGNQLSGTIPTELGLLTAMTRLGLNMMALTGTIPSELGRMTGMGTLLLHNTELTGSIPQDLVAMTALEAFTVSMTHLTGSIPDGLCYGIKEVAMKCLSYFGVQGNVCTGFEITDFSCSDSLLCGCSCSNCSST